jgi:hypothetical protein
MNFWYGYGVEDIANGAIVLPTAVVRAYGIDEQTGNYDTPDAAHRYLDSIPGGARIAMSEPLENVLFIYDGVLTIDPSVFESVTGPGQIDAVVIVVEDGGDTTSSLILHIDDMGGLPILPNGTNVDLIWNTGPDGVARI